MVWSQSFNCRDFWFRFSFLSFPKIPLMIAQHWIQSYQSQSQWMFINQTTIWVLVNEKTTDVDINWSLNQSTNHNVWDFFRSPHVKGFKCISLTIHEDRCGRPSADTLTLMHQLLYVRISQKLTRINKHVVVVVVVVDSLHTGSRGCSLVYLS